MNQHFDPPVFNTKHAPAMLIGLPERRGAVASDARTPADVVRHRDGGVRPGDQALLEQLFSALARRRADIRAILVVCRVPLAP